MVVGSLRSPAEMETPSLPAVRSALLVEGVSDQIAIETLAERQGRDLAVERVVVVPMGGSKNIGAFLARYGPLGLDLGLAGLCDAREEPDFRRGLERAGFGSNLTRAAMEQLGFFVCVADLEDELIRALGIAVVERIVEGQGEMDSLRTFRKQPAQQGRPEDQQLRRFLGTRSGRKARYARLLVAALDLRRVPRPLAGVLAHLKYKE